jgi:hypothetical protein
VVCHGIKTLKMVGLLFMGVWVKILILMEIKNPRCQWQRGFVFIDLFQSMHTPFQLPIFGVDPIGLEGIGFVVCDS